jgi:hypothetical protein
MPASRPLEDRFWEKVNRPNNTIECWLWVGAKDSGGYGQISTKNIKEPAHRCSYRMNFGEIPKGLRVLHRCDTPACVNPNHLFLGTQADNMKDMAQKGRHSRTISPGERNGFAKLTEKDVREIRQSAAPSKMLAMKYGIVTSCIRGIRNGRTWRHI